MNKQNELLQFSITGDMIVASHEFHDVSNYWRLDNLLAIDTNGNMPDMYYSGLFY